MRLKRIVAAMLSLTMVCGAGTVVTDHSAFNVSTAYAEDENPFSGFDEGIFLCEEYSDHIRVKCITCNDSEIVIPEEIHGLPVTEVGTFMKTGHISSGNVEMVTSVVIPDTVTRIGDHAFDSWTSLESVKMSKNIKYIGQDAFYRTAISEIELPEGLEEIGGYAFDGAPLKLVTSPHKAKLGDGSCNLPSTVRTIGIGAFRNTELTKFDLPDNFEIKFEITDNRSAVMYVKKGSKADKALKELNKIYSEPWKVKYK